MSDFIKALTERIKLYMDRSRFFNKNTTPKIVSIIFALVMWMYVMGEVNPETIEEWKNVSVQILNVDELRQSGLVIIGQTDFTVNVKVSGKRNDFYNISSKDMIVRADLRGFRKGVNSVPLEYSAPTNISVLDISPKEIKVTLDEIVRRQKSVVVNTQGEAAKGYEPAIPVVSPSEVIVEGPESIVNNVANVEVELNLNNREIDIKDRLPLKAVNSEGKEVNGVEIKTKLVRVTMPIYKVKDVPIRVDTEGSLQEKFKIVKTEVNPSSVIIKGPRALVDKINEIITESLNIAGLNKDLETELALVLPDGIETPYLQKNPNITLTIEEILIKEFTFSRESIAVDNLEDKYKIDLSNIPENIKIQLEAEESVIRDLNKDDIQLYINVKGLKEGKYSSKILYNIPIKPDKVTITPANVDFDIISDGDTVPQNTEESTNPAP